MVGCVRLYLEPKPWLPESRIPASFTPVVDCDPPQAAEMQRQFRRQNFIVYAFPI